MNKFKTIVFDLDGTLVDSAPDIMQSLNTVLLDANRTTLALDAVIGMIGDGIPRLVERGFAATGHMPSPALLNEHIAQCLAVYSQNPCDKSSLYPGVMNGLLHLQRAGIAMAVCTNKSEGIARQVLHALKIDRFFEAVVGGDTLDVKKPDPRHLLHALQPTTTGTNLSTSNAIMVGDSYNDIRAANNANIPVAFVTYGYNSIPLDDLVADLDVYITIDSFDALVDTLVP